MDAVLLIRAVIRKLTDARAQRSIVIQYRSSKLYVIAIHVWLMHISVSTRCMFRFIIIEGQTRLLVECSVL